MFSLFAFIHLANAQEMMQSESLEIDAFVERLETNPASSGTWHVLNSSIGHTFAGRTSMTAKWVEESELSPKLLQDMHNEARTSIQITSRKPMLIFTPSRNERLQ